MFNRGFSWVIVWLGMKSGLFCFSILIYFFYCDSAEAFAHRAIVYVHAENTLVLESFRNLKNVEYITTEPDRLPHSSTGDIIKVLRHRGKKAALICHGKAAADCLETLILHPELQSKIETWTVIDGHIQGAPNAEGAREPLLPLEDTQSAGKKNLLFGLRSLLYFYYQWVFGFDRVRFHFRPDQRKHYLNQNREALFKLAQSLDMVSIDQSLGGYGYMPFSRRETRP